MFAVKSRLVDVVVAKKSDPGGDSEVAATIGVAYQIFGIIDVTL